VKNARLSRDRAERKWTEKQNHEDRLRGRVARIHSEYAQNQDIPYFFLVVFLAFFAGAFFVAMSYHPLPLVK